MPAADLVLGADTDAIPRARRFTKASLRERPAMLVEDAELVVAELVTNALLHGRPPITLRLRHLPGRLRIEVEDRGRHAPVRALHSSDAMTGRGLALVSALASAWGVEPPEGGHGKVVWAELEATGEPGSFASAGEVDAVVLPGREYREPPAPMYTVRLGEVPTDMLLAAKSHIDNLVRELTLTRQGGVPGRLPEQVANLVGTVTQGFASARAEIKRQAIAAFERGEHETELVLTQPASAADAGEAYLAALDEADRYARAARLLTLETPPVHRAFRRWYVQSLVDQIRAQAEGRRPPMARTFQEVLADEVTRLAGLEAGWDRLQMLQRVTGELTGAETVEQIAGAVARSAAQFMGAAVQVYVLSDDGVLRTVAGEGGTGEALAEIPLHLDHPATVVVRGGAPLLLRNVTQIARRFPQLAGGLTFEHALHVAPLTVAEHRLGVLSIAFPVGSDFDEAPQAAFVTALAGALAQALERALALARAAGANAALTQANERLGFLARASIVLSESVDHSQTCVAVADLVVPALADWCVLELQREAGLAVCALAHADPWKAPWARQLRERPPLGPAGPGASRVVARTGASALFGDLAAGDLDRLAADPTHRNLLRRLRPSSAVVVPVVGRTGILGTMTLLQAGSGRTFTRADVSFAEDFARRAALALETAESFQDQAGRLADATVRAGNARADLVAPRPDGDAFVVVPLPPSADPPRPRVDPGVWFRSFHDSPLMFSAVADLDGRILDANATSVEGVGFSREDVIGRHFWEGPWWGKDTAVRRRVRRWCTEAAAGALVRDESVWWDVEGNQRWVDVAVHPVADENRELRHLSLSGLDVTDRVLAQNASAVSAAETARQIQDVADARAATIGALEAAQARLDGALQLSRQILDSVADGIYGLDRGLRISFANPASAAIVGYRGGDVLGQDVHDLIHRSPDGGPAPRGECAAVRALLSGEIVRAEQEWYRRADGSLIPVESVAVPMLDDGVVTGVVVSFRDRTERIAAERRSEVLRDLEARAAIQRELANQVQRALLTEPPPIPGLDVAVRYSTATRDAQIGGDWYDVVAQPDGSVLVVVGDVLGHDTSAAAVMAQLRGLLRGIACDAAARPSEILSRFEAAATRHGITALATCVFGRLGPPDAHGRRLLEWSNAGHLPPVVRRRDGTVVAFRTPPDLLLGLQPDTRADHTTDLEPGDLLVLYTDGLVERRGEDLDAGIAALRRTLAALGTLPIGELSDLLLRQMLPVAAEDDVALVAVSLS